MTQTAEHVAKRAAAMRGKPRPGYTKPLEPTDAQLASYARHRALPKIACPNGCGGLFKQGGSMSTHLLQCGTKCVLDICANTDRGGLGYCGLHYRILKNVREHGLTVESYLALYASQGGRCKICSTPGTYKGQQIATGAGKKNDVLCIDHDHATGRVRGLLCHPCNIALGYLRDDVPRLRAAIDYLEQS